MAVLALVLLAAWLLLVASLPPLLQLRRTGAAPTPASGTDQGPRSGGHGCCRESASPAPWPPHWPNLLAWTRFPSWTGPLSAPPASRWSSSASPPRWPRSWPWAPPGVPTSTPTRAPPWSPAGRSRPRRRLPGDPAQGGAETRPSGPPPPRRPPRAGPRPGQGRRRLQPAGRLGQPRPAGRAGPALDPIGRLGCRMTRPAPPGRHAVRLSAYLGSIRPADTAISYPCRRQHAWPLPSTVPLARFTPATQ